LPRSFLSDLIRRAAIVLAVPTLAFCAWASQSVPPSGRAASSRAIQALQALQPTEARTRILVLGTFHLRQVEKSFKPVMLDSLVRELREFKPDAICVESLSGPRVRELELRRGAGPLYGELLEGFAARHRGLAGPALSILKTTPEEALVRMRELVSAVRSAPPASVAAARRADLVLWMLAAYEPASAVLQWSYLGSADRAAQRTVPPDLARRLDDILAEVNEVYALAVPLARGLGLPTLEGVDDFEDLDAYAWILPQMEKDFERNPLLAAASKDPVYARADALREECLKKGDLRPLFGFLNSADYAAEDVAAQWGVFLRTHFPSGTDRARLGLWENRNLKIAAHIRAVAALHPGGRVLVIYGAAHRPFLEDYLAQAADIQIVHLGAAGPEPPAGRRGN
jgi:hypothetical protein